MEEKKQRTHKVLDKHPVFGSILATGIFIVIFYITMSAADLALIQFMSEGMASGPAILVGFMISTLLFWWWFRDETKGLWIGGDIKAGGCAILLMVIYWIVSVIQGIIVSGDRYGLPKPEDVSLAVSAGFMEDTVMRGFIIMLLLRKKRTPKMIMASMIVTSLIFYDDK